MSTEEEGFMPVEQAEVEDKTPVEELETPTKASSTKESADSASPSNRYRLPDQANKGQTTYVFKPDKPKMGGLVRTGRDDWTPWVGGKPKVDWSGLMEGDKDQYIDPRQFRPTSAGSVQKSKGYQTISVDPRSIRPETLSRIRVQLHDG